MQVNRSFLVITSVVLSLFLASSFAVAQITGGSKTITSTTFAAVYGNNGNVVPGASDASDVYNNHVTIENSAVVYGSTYGGATKGNGNVTANTVTVNGKAIAVYGGYTSGTGSVSDNKLEINGTVTSAYGAWIDNTNSSAVVSNNTVIFNGTFTANVIAGYTNGSGDVINNTLIINNAAATVYGGYTVGAGNASGNKVEVSGTAAKNVYGCYTTTGTASNNIVEISGTAATAYGGFSSSGNASYNRVEISGTVTNAYGGVSNSSAGTGTVTNNTVVVTGRADYAFGGYAGGSGDVTYNLLVIEATGSSNNIFGGLTAGLGNVNYNKIIINGAVKDVYGGWINSTSSQAEANYNTVIINGTVIGTVWGGFTLGSGTASYNTVTINGTVVGNVYAGDSNLKSGDVTNNTINITATAILANASLYGFHTNGTATDNTLNVYGFCGDIVSISNFDTYNFELGQLTSSLEFIIISGVGNSMDIDYTNITISFAPEFLNNNLSVGDVVTVVNSITNSNPGSETITIVSSSFVAYNFTESYDTGQLLLTLTAKNLQPQTKVVGETFAAGLAFLGQAADVRSSIYWGPQVSRFVPFATMSYGRQYITTGSSITVKGFSALTGLAFNTNFDNGSQLVVGAFIEGGWGDYNSRNSFNNYSAVKGKGDTEYYGGGVLVHYAMASGLYVEGTFAAGKTETDFRSWDFTPGTRTQYDFSVPYYSTHLGVGQVLNLTDLLELDVYAKYLWTKQKGDNVTVDGYRFKFKDADSHRLRVGGKLQANVSPQLQPYAGGAFEYEFSGRIKGSLYGMHMDKPSLRGGTSIGELGLVWSPTESGNFKVDLGVQGYVGKREGVSGGLTVSMSF